MKKLLKKTVAVAGIITMMAMNIRGCVENTEREMCEETEKCNR